MLLNLKTLDWDRELLKLFGVPATALPEVRESSGDFGEAIRIARCGHSHPGRGGRPAGRRVRTGLFRAGRCEVHLWHRLFRAGQYRRQSAGLHKTGCWRPRLSHGKRAVYAIEGSIFIAGAVVQWLRDELGVIGSAEEIEALARTAKEATGTLFRAGLHRAGRALLGSGGARRHRGSDARHGRGRDRARRAGCGLLSDARSAGSDGAAT